MKHKTSICIRVKILNETAYKQRLICKQNIVIIDELVYKSAKVNSEINSLLVAEKFGKEQENMIRAIENFMA